MEVESVSVRDESSLTRIRFDAAVKVIKTLPPDGELEGGGGVLGFLDPPV